MFVPVRIHQGAGGGQTVYARNIGTTERQFTAFSAHAGNMSEPLREIGKIIDLSVAQQFATQGAAGATGKWTQLSESYGAWKQKHGAGVPLLVGLKPTGAKRKRDTPQAKATRALYTQKTRRKAQTYAPSGLMRQQLLDPLATWVGPKRLLYAPVSDIAGYHETGTSKMPARPPLDLTLTNLRAFDRVFVVWLNKLVHQAGL